MGGRAPPGGGCGRQAFAEGPKALGADGNRPSFLIEQAEDAIHALAGAVPGLNPLRIAIVPGAPRVSLRATEQIA